MTDQPNHPAGCGGCAYGARINAPMRFETAAELRRRLESVDVPRRKVRRQGGAQPALTADPSLRDRALDAAKQAINASGYWLPVDGQTAVVDAVLALVGAETCCGCEGGPVTYRNYRDQPFCRRCADGQPVGAACIHPDGYEGECPCPSSCTCCVPTAATSDACLDIPQLTAVIGHPIRCPHCGTTVLLTHWVKHLQGHYPETGFGEYEQAMRRTIALQARLDAARAWGRQHLEPEQQAGLLAALRGATTT